MLGHPEWATDERFVRNQDRVDNRDAIDALVRDVMLERTRAEWIAALEPVGIPAGPINTVAEALASEQTRARDMVTESNIQPRVCRDGRDSVQDVRYPPSIRLPPPRLGEHSRSVLDELGLDEAEIDKLVADGVTTLEET